MNNLFQTQLPIHQRYDLKGSTQGRGQGASGVGTILKDLDLNIQLKLEESWHARYESFQHHEIHTQFTMPSAGSQ